MDRELVLAVLIALLCGGALTVSGSWLAGPPDTFDDPACERRAWRRLWLPFAPALIILATLAGWALREPASAERVPNFLLWSALPFAALFVRTAWRALRSLASPDKGIAVATVGVLRPRIVISPRIVTALDRDALAAAIAHERAHARHRDPLRLWLAQIGTDLLWPWPAAHSRLVSWKRALECARDDEARRTGADGPALAAAILIALRLTRADTPSSGATLCGDEAFLKRRVLRLLQPLNTAAPRPKPSSLWRVVPALVAISLAILAGSAFGEGVVRAFFGLV
ncbi:MAG TPA: M56 family metallopeptidase [Candidatus Binataceae bacterium]|jgi:hypothetical protein|nr:M56 family metallopeptidase [Candidatus Binataceae bacterium]